MVWSIAEYIATIVEYIIYADFMIRFLKPKNKNQLWLIYAVISLSNITITLVLNHFFEFEGFLCFLRICTNFIYARYFLKGKMFEKIFASMVTDISVLLINLLTLNILSGILGESISTLITERCMIRIFILFITKALFFVFTRFMIRIKEKNEYTFQFAEWLILTIIFLITMFVEIELFFISMQYHLSLESPFAVSIGIGLILVNIFVYILMMRISRNNKEKTSLIIDRLQLAAYRSQLQESEKQYNEINKIHHDMKNHLQCIQLLLAECELERAQCYIDDILQNKLCFGVHFVKSQNKAVDIVANIKLHQCQNENIQTSVNIGNFELNIDDVDICIILANLFDNAIEYCRKSKDKSYIYFEIMQKKRYVNIILKNSITESVLDKNPTLKTSKKNKTEHGIGLKSVLDTVKKNEGMIDFYEKDNYFIVDVWLPSEK